MPDVVIIVPARGGSTRIPDKNIVPLCGKPLLLYTLDAALEAVDRADLFVSTDAGPIAAVARAAGVAVIDRPEALAGETASTESAPCPSAFTRSRRSW